jgi:integrase
MKNWGVISLENRWIEDWLASVCESEKTVRSYVHNIAVFTNFCRARGLNFSLVVEDWRRAKRLGEVEREDFLERWGDAVRSFFTYVKKQHAPLTTKNFIVTIKSFFRFWDIPVKAELPKRACVVYHNRDLTREEVRLILTYASPRDRVIWLLMVESGMRADTAVHMQYWQLKEDFEAERVPMRIILPSSTLKDRVGDRWTFVGEDGFRELKNYLTPRLPLNDDDFVFASEKAGKVVGEQFSVASLSVKFNRLVQKLGLDKSRLGKPKRIRMHGLRRYFRNYMKCDEAFRKFWMGHSLGVDAHYITRDPEAHRREYAKGYQHLRIFEPSEALAKHYVTLDQFEEMLKRKDNEIKELRTMVKEMASALKELGKATGYWKPVEKWLGGNEEE